MVVDSTAILGERRRSKDSETTFLGGRSISLGFEPLIALIKWLMAFYLYAWGFNEERDKSRRESINFLRHKSFTEIQL